METVSLQNINDAYINKEITVFGRVDTIRTAGQMCFIILRNKLRTLQCMIHKKIINNNVLFKEITKIPKESFIEIIGILSKLPDEVQKVESCFYKDFELQGSKVNIVSIASELPIEIDSANQIYAEQATNSTRINISLSVRLDNRSLELRAPMNSCIFKLQSASTEAFRNYLLSKDFIEIHTPKTIGTSSEGGSAVFELKFFERKAYLAQSPQLYKQMAINADMERVFEIGPVFRAENCVSHRHLCEFTGLDFEMALTPPYNYIELIENLWGILTTIFEYYENKYPEETNYLRGISKCDKLLYSKDPLIFKFSDGVKLLQENGFHQEEFEDLSTENEKQLGNIIKKLTGYDIFVLCEYPVGARPFYTMLSDDPRYTKSYDIIMRGEEICSGSQRINNYYKLIENIKSKGVDPSSLKDYLKSFTYGSRPHGGAGLGLERILMLYFGLFNVRLTSMFPRDSSRITP